MGWREQAITVAVPSDDLVLEGLFQAGGPRGAVVAPPHPLYGGSFDHPVVNDLAFGLHRAEVASVRFNWRGVGASQGAPTGDPGAAKRDYAAALDHVAATVPGPITGCGYSFGAATALMVALEDPRIRQLILVAPPLAMLERLEIERFAGPLVVIVGSDDAYAPLGGLTARVEPLQNAKLEVIARADHFFSQGLAELSERVRSAAT